MQSPNPLRASSAHGHSVWLDYNARRLLITNELERLVEQDGVPWSFASACAS
jgi:YD repeat-containing protein